MTDIPQPAGDGDVVVQPGDSVVSIAARAGLLPDTIWNDAANAALKEARTNPEILLPGDRLTVMERRDKKEARVTGKRHVFTRKGVPVKFTLYVQDEDGEAFAGKKFELRVEGTKIEGTTDDTGKIECAIDADARTGMLTVWLDEPGLPNPWVREVSLAVLHPIEHPLGVQQRLANLGLYSGPLDGTLNAETLLAIGVFQTKNELEPTRELDDTLRAKLVEVHKV